MLGIKSYESGMMKITTLIALICCFGKIQWKVIDLYVFIYIFYCLITYLWGEVTVALYFDGIVTQIMPISMYFIARCIWLKDIAFLEKMKWPLFFAFVCALVLYFKMPSWYYDFKTAQWDFEKTGTSFYENMRLSGFWPWSYFLGYASLFYLMYELKKNVIDNIRCKSFFLTFVPALAVLFLAQQRVSIFYFFIYIIFLLLYAKRNRMDSYRPLIKWCIVFLVLFFLLFSIALIDFDEDFVQYIIDRSIGSESNMIKDRFLLFDNSIKSISFLGLGLGHNSHYSRTLGDNAITDCDYLRIPNEIGIFGFSILILILLITLARGFKQIKINFYELNVVIFLMVAMIGAAPLEHLPLHPYMYWYCIGRLANDNIEDAGSSSTKQDGDEAGNFSLYTETNN